MKTDRRQILINHCKQEGQITTQTCNDLLKKYYYCNHQHYVSEILTRLVKSGIFTRVKNGLYIMRNKPLKVLIKINKIYLAIKKYDPSRTTTKRNRGTKS